MANGKEKKERKAKVKKTPKEKFARTKVARTFKVFTSKVEASDHAKRFEDRETTNHHAVVLQTLARFENPKTLEEIVEAVKESGRYGRQKNMPKMEAYISSDLRTLVKAGVVAVND